jgi:hypothetical protein
MDKSEPAEPIDRIEPDEPIERIEPVEPMDRIEPEEPMDMMEPVSSVSLLVIMRTLCPRREQGYARVSGSLTLPAGPVEARTGPLA